MRKGSFFKFIMLLLEVIVILAMFLFAKNESNVPATPKVPLEVSLSGVTVFHSQNGFESRLSAPQVKFVPYFGLIKFPSMEGMVKIGKSDYELTMKHGKIFINRWGYLQGEIEIRSFSDNHFFLASGRNFKLDFKDKTISTFFPVVVVTDNLNVRGGKMIIDLGNRIIKVSGGVKGEVKNFTP